MLIKNCESLNKCNINYIFIVLLALCSFSFTFFKKKNYVDIADELTIKATKEICEKYNMNLIGIGGGMYRTVNIISLRFQIKEPLDREKARHLIVDSVDILLEEINSCEEIRPFLKNYPFTTENIDISIFSTEKDGGFVYDPYISVVSLPECNSIKYCTEEPNGIAYKNKYRESFEEAKRLLMAKYNCISTQSATQKNETPKIE